MATQARKETKLKVACIQLPIKINGNQKSVWIDSGTPISIFTIGKLEQTLGTAGVNLNELKPEDNEFRDYGNNPLHLLGTMTVPLETNRWAVEAKIKVIGSSRLSIVGRDLMSSPRLQLIQKTPGENVISVQEDNRGRRAGRHH